MLRKILFFLLCFFVILESNAQIETTKEDTLQEIIIKADRPVSAASSLLLNQMDFKNRLKNSAQDMLKLVPGLFIAQHAGGGKAEQIFIRGFDCDHGTDVATFVDGIPVNMSSHGHGQGYEDLHFLIPETVNAISVFKGPYHAQFGNFATAAAVEFKTLDTLQNNLFLIENTYNPTLNLFSANRIMGMYELPFKNKKFTSYLAFEGNFNSGYFEQKQAFNRINVFSKSTYRFNSFHSLSFTISSFSSKWNASGQVPVRAILSNSITRFGSFDPTEGGKTSRKNINLVYKYKKKTTEFVSQIYATDYRFQLFSNFTFFLEDSINGDQIEQGDNRKLIGFANKFTKYHHFFKKKSTLQLGTNLRYDNIENDLWSTKTRERLKPKAIAKINELATNIYFNERIFLTNKLKLELGARLDVIHFDVLDRLPTDSSRSNYSGKNTQHLVSPKVNLNYQLNAKNQLFINSGYGFHSNDARSSVQELANNNLPKSFGSEIGSLSQISNKATISIALWMLQLENELVYVGDDGTTENKGSSRRIGIDLSLRYQLSKTLFVDADVNYSKNRLTENFYGSNLKTNFLIPLAPTFTSSGGITYQKNKFFTAIRYRVISDRPANESNSVKAKGYFLFDANVNYQFKKIKCGFSIENLFNQEWNEAQFDTESRLQGEQNSVSEIHFTPGTPFAIKCSVQYNF